jgi:uncharacterized protein
MIELIDEGGVLNVPESAVIRRDNSELPKYASNASIRTFTGRMFWPLNPRPEDLDIRDIAHALSLVCRFTGHTRSFYSVADHSLRVSYLAENQVRNNWRGILGFPDFNGLAFFREVALWGLLHDASEAYLCDVPSPIKHASGMGQIYRQYEQRLMDVIVKRFDLLPYEPGFIKMADRLLLDAEMRDLMACKDRMDVKLDPIIPLTSEEAEAEFLRRFYALTMALTAERTAAEASDGVMR